MTTNQDTALQVTPEDAALNTQVRMAHLLADSQFLPKHYQNKPADCLVAIQWAQRSGRDPLELLQNTFVVHGTPGMKASYMIALANREGPFSGPIRFSIAGEREEMVATAWGIIEGERYEVTFSWQQAQLNGWTDDVKMRKGGTMPSKYKTMPDVMLRYRAATLLVRLYCPEVLLGMSTTDELDDIRHQEEPVRISPALDALNARSRGETEIVGSPVEKEAETQESPAQEPADPKAWPLQDADGEDVPF